MEDKKGLRSLFKGKQAAKADTPQADSGEISAAVAMALYLHFGEMHDVESGVVTIKRISKLYSPWSSKLYHMRNL